MKITIEFDTDSPRDAAIWALVSSSPAAQPTLSKAPAAKLAAVPRAEPEEPTPADESDEDFSAEPAAATLADAVATATTAIQAGKSAVVKAALKSVGATRVSDLKGDKIAGFIAALS